MKKVYQTISDPGKGNCMQAAIASLLELKLEEVPNFISFGREWFKVMHEFLYNRGYETGNYLYNKQEAVYYDKEANIVSGFGLEDLKDYEGIGGYFYAVVRSPKFSDDKERHSVTHAVIIDKNLNIVHGVYEGYDNLKQYPLADKIGYNGILYVMVIEKIGEEL